MYNMYRNDNDPYLNSKNMFKKDNYKDNNLYNNYRDDSYPYFNKMDYDMNYYNPYSIDYDRQDDMYLISDRIGDYGLEPFAVNLKEVTRKNDTFRTALWTGKHLQLTIMSINVGDDIGVEIHHNTDQLIYIEQGRAISKMGDRKENLDFQRNVYEGYAIFVPAGKWHNIINSRKYTIKVIFSICSTKSSKRKYSKNKACCTKNGRRIINSIN